MDATFPNCADMLGCKEVDEEVFEEARKLVCIEMFEDRLVLSMQGRVLVPSA